jgi:hypothetical protein
MDKALVDGQQDERLVAGRRQQPRHDHIGINDSPNHRASLSPALA